MSIEGQLCDVYNLYLEKHGLPKLSAEELLAEDCLTSNQREWVALFLYTWNLYIDYIDEE